MYPIQLPRPARIETLYTDCGQCEPEVVCVLCVFNSRTQARTGPKYGEEVDCICAIVETEDGSVRIKTMGGLECSRLVFADRAGEATRKEIRHRADRKEYDVEWFGP